MAELSMGIDLGTTSVKVTLINMINGDIVRSVAKPSQANILSDNEKGAEQDPVKIMSIMKNILKDIPLTERMAVRGIGITGQMHGLVLWKKTAKVSVNIFSQDNDDIPNASNCNNHDYSNHDYSPLYTWQDQRCSPEFLSSLPSPDSHLTLSTGHGCATMLWLLKHRPDYLNQFTMCGTIMDMTVWLLCDMAHPVTSPQLAASMGYFNCTSNAWNTECLKSIGFPVKYLPHIKENESVVGHLAEEFLGIKLGTPVLNSLGDVQCAAYSVIKSKVDAVLNISTSCQLTFATAEHKNLLTSCSQTSPVQYYPYFNGSFLAMAASLNGGNVLSRFVSVCRQWIKCFGLEKTKEEIWDVLIHEGRTCMNEDKYKCTTDDQASGSLAILPTLFGERHCPHDGFLFSAKNSAKFDLGNVFLKLCSSLVDNVQNMMPLKFLQENSIKRLITTGSVLERNELVRAAVKMAFSDLEIVHGGQCDSALGASLYCVECLTKSTS